jgi:hypothetical protein
MYAVHVAGNGGKWGSAAHSPITTTADNTAMGVYQVIKTLVT